MELTLESLGLSRDEVFARVVDRIAEQAMEDWQDEVDEDGNTKVTPFAKVLQAKILDRVNAAIEAIAGRHVLPNVAAYVESLCLQETNKWGEKAGKPLTFTEYLVRRAEAYLQEPVDYAGKTKEQDPHSWRAAGTRVARLVHEYLHHSIETAMKQALATANSAIVGGIEEAVKIKLGEVAASLKVKVDIGR